MTEPEAWALGARAVRAKGWGWRSGMSDAWSDTRIDWTDRDAPDPILHTLDEGEVALSRWLASPRVPDVQDPATRGCLLALVRERWGEPLLGLSVGPDGGWEVWCWDGPSRAVRGRGSTEAEALVAALEAAP